MLSTVVIRCTCSCVHVNSCNNMIFNLGNKLFLQKVVVYNHSENTD